MTQTRQILFVRAPEGMPDPGCFDMVTRPMPVMGEGQVLARIIYLSIDPYFRRQMAGAHGYRDGLRPGAVMIGRGIGEVLESRFAGLKPGDFLLGETGWREHAALDGNTLKKLDPAIQPLSLYLGLLGQSGGTAGIGLFDIARLQPGETMLVSAAAGAVGSAAGQIAKILGCRAIGIAGGADKCRHVVADLGFDACLDYKAGDLPAQIAAAAPGGIDVYFDNVGGEVLDAVLPHLNMNARVAMCGQISQYNTGKPIGIHHIGALLDKCATIQGFRVGQRLQERDAALVRLTQWYREGRLKYRETVANGLDSAPAAFISMLKGANLGKQVVRL
jgi:NADPH-dependent curcumin reductase